MKAIPNVTRWFLNCVNQPEFSSVIGQVTLASEEEQYDAKKFKSAPSVPPSPKKDKAAASPETTLELEKEDKKNPLDLLPPSPFILDEWKRFYSNNETRPDAINWFWEKYDAEGYSMWRVDYKYNQELDLLFMSSNLIGGNSCK